MSPAPSRTKQADVPYESVPYERARARARALFLFIHLVYVQSALSLRPRAASIERTHGARTVYE